MEGFSSTKEMAEDRLSPSRKLKRSSKQHITSCSDPGNHITGWGCDCRNSCQKCWVPLEGVIHESCCFISRYFSWCPTSCELHGLQSKLWRQSAAGTPFRRTCAWQWKQQRGGTVLWADGSEPVLFEVPSPPAWPREERVQWAAECLGTYYSTLPAHTAEALGLRRTKLVMRLKETEVSLPCADGPCYFIDLCVCYSLFNRSSWVPSLCWCTGLKSELVCCASRYSWKYLQGKVSPPHQNTAFHSCPDWASRLLLISLSVHFHPVVFLKKKIKLKGKQNWKKN